MASRAYNYDSDDDSSDEHETYDPALFTTKKVTGVKSMKHHLESITQQAASEAFREFPSNRSKLTVASLVKIKDAWGKRH